MAGFEYHFPYYSKYYKIYNLRYDNINGAQPLKPISKDKWVEPKRYNPWSGPIPVIVLDAKVDIDSDGYFSNIPFSTKVSDNTIFDVKLPGQFLRISGNVFLTAAADLSKISLKSSEGLEIILNPAESNSPNSLVFKSEDGAYKAIYLYSNDDLTRLARIYVESENTLMEFWTN